VRTLKSASWLVLVWVALWAPACGGGSVTFTSGGVGGYLTGGPAGTYWVLTGSPDPAAAFNLHEVCFLYPNNLTNGIWHSNSNLVITGEYLSTGYWSHPGNAGGHPSSPDNAVGVSPFHRMVHMPLTQLVAYTITSGFNGIEVANSSQLRLATLDRFTGVLGAEMTPVYSDGYAGSCNVLSSSIDELLILENDTTIRRYRTTAGSGNLVFLGTVTLSVALPADSLCIGGCYGGSFAWDGAFYYFSVGQTTFNNLAYNVYQPDGTFVANHVASGPGTLTSVYFDWSVGRYARHDGWGGSTAPLMFDSVGGGGSDLQCYGATSAAHTFHP
jgi:hypothetical protein